jgi:hypothetical protein
MVSSVNVMTASGESLCIGEPPGQDEKTSANDAKT